MNGMKTPLAILIAGLLIAVAVYAGLTDDRRSYMKGCLATLISTAQSEQDAEATCAIHYKR